MQIKQSISGVSEEDFEFQSNYKKVDESAGIEIKEQMSYWPTIKSLCKKCPFLHDAPNCPSIVDSV